VAHHPDGMVTAATMTVAEVEVAMEDVTTTVGVDMAEMIVIEVMAETVMITALADLIVMEVGDVTTDTAAVEAMTDVEVVADTLIVTIEATVALLDLTAMVLPQPATAAKQLLVEMLGNHTTEVVSALLVDSHDLDEHTKALDLRVSLTGALPLVYFILICNHGPKLRAAEFQKHGSTFGGSSELRSFDGFLRMLGFLYFIKSFSTRHSVSRAGSA